MFRFFPILFTLFQRFPFFLRSVLVLLGGFLPLVGFPAFGLPANGQLCVLMIGYMAASRWKKENNQCGQVSPTCIKKPFSILIFTLSVPIIIDLVNF